MKTDEVDWMDLNILQEMIQRELRSEVCEDVPRCSVLSFPLASISMVDYMQTLYYYVYMLAWFTPGSALICRPLY